MGLLLLVRHGETDWNREGIWQGHGDPPLNELGRRQGYELAARLACVELEAIYSSDLRRAQETADIVAAVKRMRVIPTPGLREIDVGSWSGLTREQIAERFPDAEHHDGEPFDAFQSRAVETIESIAARHDGARVLLVTHGGVIRALQRHASGEPAPVLANCELCSFRYGNGTFSPID